MNYGPLTNADLSLEDAALVVAFLALARGRLLDGPALQHAVLVDPVLLGAAPAVNVLRRTVETPVDVATLLPASWWSAFGSEITPSPKMLTCRPCG